MHFMADLALKNNSILFSFEDFNCRKPIDSMCKQVDGCCYCEKRKKEDEKLDDMDLGSKTLEG